MSVASSGRRYCLICPCRDEADTLERTVRSVVAQSVPPELLLIVDDGSTDGTSEIADALSEEIVFVETIHRPDRGRRSVGPGVIETFRHGFDSIDLSRFDYVCKFDADLDLPPRYFERVLEEMERDPAVGAFSGKAYFFDGPEDDGRLLPEPCGDDVCVGMIKFYRKECFEAIGGFVQAVMWDGIDAHSCRMLGWKHYSVDEPDLRFIHLRPMGSSDQSILKGRVRWGGGQYFMGTSPWYMLASVVRRLTTRPLIIGALCMGWGYLRAALTRAQRYDNLEFRRFLRRYHRLILRHGKTRACELVLARTPNSPQR